MDERVNERKKVPDPALLIPALPFFLNPEPLLTYRNLRLPPSALICPWPISKATPIIEVAMRFGRVVRNFR
jgi:hypothetical protein